MDDQGFMLPYNREINLSNVSVCKALDLRLWSKVDKLIVNSYLGSSSIVELVNVNM